MSRRAAQLSFIRTKGRIGFYHGEGFFSNHSFEKVGSLNNFSGTNGMNGNKIKQIDDSATVLFY
jgi:hypothetical protein